ncbi:hypothetical protein THAOC_37240 [Thalassiosira oceanica]|uniref:Uncharacterized protein n=1 Tax=Thalassiosira oceanica TaxID=159749 RepID=K0QYM8_THAOC|nr:hypothetical protein THAOC_37240 [Thalassiosira oceanica]|eukprot:EJK44238.1 hypothetical protein THAOC_37240 [Thalassiosira oceanica]
MASSKGAHELVALLETELGGRRCEIVGLTSRSDLNGKTCVADEYLPASNQYKVTLENKTKEVLVLGPDNLTRRDRTPQDCGYYIEFRNGRTIRHDFDSREECRAFVAALNGDGMQPVVTEEAEAAAEQAAAELPAVLGLDDSSVNVVTSGDKAKKFKKKKGKRKKKNKSVPCELGLVSQSGGKQRREAGAVRGWRLAGPEIKSAPCLGVNINDEGDQKQEDLPSKIELM